MATMQHASDQLSRAEEIARIDRHPLGMTKTLRRVAILGAGTMGSRIAAHFANAGVASLLLSRAKPNEPNRSATAVKAIAALVKQKPAAFFAEDTKRLVKPGNLKTTSRSLADCDWVIETVAENLEIKRELWHQGGSGYETRNDSFDLHQRHHPGQDRGRLPRGVPPSFPRHALFQSDSIHALAGGDSRARDRLRGDGVRSGLRRAPARAREWSPAKIRRISSPTASAAFSAPPSPRSRWRATTPSRKPTR